MPSGSSILKLGLLGAVFSTPFALMLHSSAAGPTLYEFDLRGSARATSASTLKLGDAQGKPGETLGVNSYYFVRDCKPWFPVMGEMHYSRYPRQYWEEALMKIKAGGINVVATYVFWNHHEPVEGQWNWSGNRSLREFLQLCAKHGIYACVRLGPWSHGEARNGGHPDWLLKKGIRLRSSDPQYLAYAREVYGQIWTQCQGQLFKDGGPVIGIQVENEMTGNPEYLRTLKQIAREIGFDVPFYTATAWMSARLPDNEFLPVWAAYADMPWDNFGRAPVPPRKQFLFTGGLDLFDRRTQDAPGAGLDLNKLISGRLLDKATWLPDGYPYAMAELGGGLQVVRARRPVLTAKDTADMAYVAIGKGANLVGYYMYHGGSQPAGLEEQVCPKVSYDFQAPLGEFGYTRELYHCLRALHLFVRDFSAELAPAWPVLPAQTPSEPKDSATLRSIVRSANGKGFLFWSNYHRGVEMRDLGPLQFSVRTTNGTLLVPRKPAIVPHDAFGIWPFNLSIGSAVLKYATAQPLSVIHGAEGISTYFFFASEGVPSEYVFDSRTIRGIETRCAKVSHDGEGTLVADLAPGTGCSMTIRRSEGAVRLVTLTNEQSRRYWKAEIAGREYAFLSDADLQFDGDEIVADSIDRPDIELAVYPALVLRTGSKGNADGIFTRYRESAQPKHVDVSLRSQQPGKWTLGIGNDAMTGLADVLLDIQYASALGKNDPFLLT